MIYLGADHGGFKLKKTIKDYFTKKKIAFSDLGNHHLDKNDDYPDYAKLVAQAVAKNTSHRGILICSSGQGMCTAANKFKNIRASFGYSVPAVKASRNDGDSNILCLPGKGLPSTQIVKIVDTWLATPFSNLIRHKRRIKKISQL